MDGDGVNKDCHHHGHKIDNDTDDAIDIDNTIKKAVTNTFDIGTCIADDVTDAIGIDDTVEKLN